MKFSERWLREWVDPAVDTDTLAAQLTNAAAVHRLRRP